MVGDPHNSTFFIKLIPESEFSTLFLSLCGLSEGVWGCKYGINKK